MTPVDVLVKARALIAEPEAWTQGDYAKNANGNTAEFDGSATCYCMAGALIAVSIGNEDILYLEARMHLRRTTGSTITFNDTPGRTHDEVLAAFDKAIEAARAG